MPRVIGMRCGRKSTATIPGLADGSSPSRPAIPASSCSISATWRCPPTPYACDALVDLAEQEAGLEFPPGARYAALGVDDEIADQPGAGQRREREERRRRVAAGRADDGDRGIDERLELVAVELRQAVDRDVEQVRPRVLEAVPARVVGGVA